MTSSCSPEERSRLKALEDLMLLDTPADLRFERIVQFASQELGVPISMVSLVDEHRQWFKARVGLRVQETPRSTSFCAHAIASSEIFVIEDATHDARFASNPLVTGDPHIRFYAGAPISAPSGERVGTICVIDTKPRSPGILDLAILDALRYVVDEILAGGDGDLDRMRIIGSHLNGPDLAS